MIQLAVDTDSYVSQLPVGNLMDIGGMLRRMADMVDAGDYGEVISMITLAIRPDGMTICPHGEAMSHYELMGLFEAAKLRVFADDVVADD